MTRVAQHMGREGAAIQGGGQHGEAGIDAALGAVLGALGMAMAAALVVAVIGASGGIQAVTTQAPVAAAPAAGTAGAAPIAMPGMDMSGMQHAAAGAAALAAAKPVTVPSIGRSATDVPPAITRTSPATVRVDLQTREVVAEIEPGETYTYMTFDGTVPGPMLRVRVGDTVELHLRNAPDSKWPHSIDLHAVTGPGGGATGTQTPPGQESVLHFKALVPGLFVYHCASQPIPMHIAEGMYGLILVEPVGGLPKVDHEFYAVQAELYTNAPKGTPGHHEFDQTKVDAEQPDYVVMNGKVGGLTGDHAMTAKVGETARFYFGVGGFLPSSLHLIGGVFDRVYVEAGSLVNTNVQTTLVPAGGATMAEVRFSEPGTYTLLDHSIARAMDKGALAQVVVTGEQDKSIFDGPVGGGGH